MISYYEKLRYEKVRNEKFRAKVQQKNDIRKYLCKK